MTPGHLRIRVKSRVGELEVEGPREFVEEFRDTIAEIVAGMTSDEQPLGTTRQDSKAFSAPTVGALPETFGELFHLLPPTAADNDRVLLAGVYVSRQDNQFTTQQANELLLTQGVKVANPSVCLKRLRDKKHIIQLEQGVWRISPTGAGYVSRILAAEDLKQD